MVFALILSLLIPLPLVGGSAFARADDGASHVMRRLNSPERAAAIEEARRIDAAAHEAFARGDGKSVSLAQTPPEQTPAKATSAQEIQKDGLPRGVAARNDKDKGVSRPKTMTEVMFNGVAGFMGMPGLAGSQYDPYDPNADQGLGFHADGTARRADGTTGSNSASANFDGRRAASYAGSGLGYGPNGMRGGYGMGANDINGYYGAGYDPVTGHNYRLGDMSMRRPRSMNSGGYGLFNMDDPQSYFMQRGLNYGMGMVNSAAEGLFLGFGQSPYGGAKARFNFMVDLDGRVNGEGDVLLPFYDSQHTTIFTQLGARSMSGMSGGGSDGRGADRWIGNFGLGQRWYPMAVNDGAGQDAGNLMLGYNVFFDNDFTRSHQRGGIGIEAQYDWMHLASNYYFPLSGWKGSYDYDSKFVEERPAEGWDIRAKGYLPFYRNIAVTGAYTQWYGDHVAMFSSRKLEKDPAVWSYGLEYTPIPLVSGFVNQRSTERGRSDTEFGLRFTYTFDMPWEQQVSHAKVAEMRTVGASRHEFVDRENRIILEYRAKNNYHVEFMGRSGDVFTFRIKHAFDKYAAGKAVRVSATGVTTLAEAKTAPTTFLAQAGEFLGSLFSVSTAHAADLFQTYVTDRNGEFRVTITGLTAVSGVTVDAGNTSRTFTAAELGGSGGDTAYDIAYVSGHQGTLAQGDSMTMVYSLTKQGTADPAPDGTAVTLLAQTQGGSVTAQKLVVASGTVAGGSGQVSLSFNGISGSSQDGNQFLARTVVLYGKVGSVESAASSAVTVGTIPSGSGGSYLTGVAGTTMTWATAKNYCASHGGKLPLVNPPSTSQSTGQVFGGTATVSGTGTIDTSSWNTPWGNTGLPSSPYWTGTEVTDASGDSWFIYGDGGDVSLSGGGQGYDSGVVCVP